MDLQQHCYNNKCYDKFHVWMGEEMTQYNHMGDVFVFLNIAILLYVISQGSLNCQVGLRVLLIGSVLYFIRWVLSCTTVCDANVDKRRRPWTSTSTCWYIISGHTLNALLVSFLILNSQSGDFLKYSTVICACAVLFFQTVTREHYTVDIILTVLIVHLSIKAYIK